jgi:serine protease
MRKILYSLVVALGVVGAPAMAGTPHETVMAVGGPAFVEADLLEIKFHENQLIRLRNDRPEDLAGRGLKHAQARALLQRVASGKWMRSHDVAEEALEQMQAEGERNAQEALPDLNLYFRLRLPPGLDADEMADAFRKLPEVEAVYRVPRPVPPPVAPDYYTVSSTRPYQRYQDPAPSGIDGRFAGTLAGARGTGVKICNIEYSFNAAHADLGVVTLVGPAWVDPFSSTDHGTAVIGVFGGTANTEGVTGIAYAAQKLFAAAQTASGYNVGAAITTCANSMSPGDIILIEQQMAGPNGGTNYVPVEWFKPTYDAIRAAVAANRVVVETAGNGSQNLDSSTYSTGNNGHYPFLPANDSGAIMVGAGWSPAQGSLARSARNDSNYGATLDLQGWGDSVVTAGYGNLYSAEGINRWFTSTFAGTSSAGPIVAGAAASLQGRNKQVKGAILSPASIKSILRNNGTAQTGTRNIGPLPDLRRALGTIL